MDRSFDDLRVIDLAAAGEEIAMFGLDTLANAVRVSYFKGTVPANIVEAGGVPPAFAAQFGTDGMVFEVIDELPMVLPVPGLPLPSASEIPLRGLTERGCTKCCSQVMERRISRRTVWIGAASAVVVVVAGVLATAGPRWLAGQQPSGSPSIGVRDASATALPSESPSLADMANQVTVAGIQVTLPPGWSYRLPTFVSWGPAKPIIYFSNQPMHDECTRIGNSETCDRPIDGLVADGVLIDWWASGDYWLQSPAPLRSGSPYEVGGLEAVRYMVDVELCGLHATEMEPVVLRRATMGRDVLTICARGLTTATRAELEELLASIEFLDAGPE